MPTTPDTPGEALPEATFKGRRVLVTGGTGFVGGRLVERLAHAGALVRVLVRNFSRATRIARFPVEMVAGDLIDAGAVAKAVRDVDTVFHCAVGSGGDEDMERRVTVDGTRGLLDASLSGGVGRFVNVSTAMVYAPIQDGVVDETSPASQGTDQYTTSKLAAEAATFEYARRGLGAAVVQPTIVYGPFGSTWTTRILNELKAGRVILVDGGGGLCSAVYVDDVVSGMLLAATRDEAVGEAFLITAEEPVTWKEFYGQHERMLGFTSTVEMPLEEAEKMFNDLRRRESIFRSGLSILRDEKKFRRRLKKSVEVDALLKLSRKVVPASLRRNLRSRVAENGSAAVAVAAAAEEVKIHPTHPIILRAQTAKARVSIDKAKRLLGYRPAFDFEAGMRATEEWARWAGLLEHERGGQAAAR